MTTPLSQAIEAIQQQGRSPFHMPGHKGNAPYCFEDVFSLDLTEVEGADSLYQTTGAIAALEREYAALYGARASLISAGGSTLCIQTMLVLVARPGGKILLPRMVHSSAVAAMALLGLEPVWLWPQVAQTADEGLPGMALPLTPAVLAAGLEAHPDATAVYLTSPDYTGQMCDVAALADLCHSRGKPLLVDNAHGAHLGLLEGTLHPMAQGADLCCDSLHKTLPVLTGGALLHVGNEEYIPQAKAAMAFFGSTSPSYLIMLSIDRALPYLQTRYAGEAALVAAEIAALEETARQKGFALAARPCEPLRLTLGFGPLGYDDHTFGDYLRGAGIEPEYLGGGVCVLMASPCNTPKDWARLRRAVEKIVPLPPLPPQVFLPQPPPGKLSLRTAMLGPRQTLPLSDAVGRVAAAPLTACPPGIPLAVPGEEITPQVADRLKNSGIDRVVVVK